MKDIIMENIMLVNIAWNPHKWREPYSDPKSGHSYVREHSSHESLNFKFNKSGIDDKKYIHGFAKLWSPAPKRFNENGLIIFWTKNTETKERLIVGMYGKANLLEVNKEYYYKDFENGRCSANIQAEKDFSMLFPVYLNDKKYEKYKNKKNSLMCQTCFTYKDDVFAKEIILDEINKLKKMKDKDKEEELIKLKTIYKYYFGNNDQL